MSTQSADPAPPPSDKPAANDYDGAWKDLLSRHFSEALLCYFPNVHARIDWQYAPTFHDQELREIDFQPKGNPPAKTKRNARRVDILAKTRFLDGSVRVIYIHLEVQCQKEDSDAFTHRLFQCHVGIRKAFQCDTITLAILGDLDPHWRPDQFQFSLVGCECTFRFPICKLLDILPRLENDHTLPALAAKAQILALRTSRNVSKRLAVRRELTRMLLDRKASRQEIQESLRLVSWMFPLPEPQRLQFREEMATYTKAKNMPYLCDIEIHAMEKGRQEGRQEGEQRLLRAQQTDVLEALKLRFKRVPVGLREAVQSIDSTKKLHALLRAAILSDSLDAFAEHL